MATATWSRPRHSTDRCRNGRSSSWAFQRTSPNRGGSSIARSAGRADSLSPVPLRRAALQLQRCRFSPRPDALMRTRSFAAVLVLFPLALSGQTVQQAAPAPAPPGFGDAFKARPLGDGAIKVGPAKGTVLVVGGGAMGPEVYKAFIDAAGGPDAIILDVPNAGGEDTVSANTGAPWRNNGAKNVVVL